MNRWTHLVVTITQSGLVTIYKKGRLASSGQSAGLRNVTRRSNFIGRSDYPADGFFAGSVDEAAIYDKAVGGARIATQHYKAAGAGDVVTRRNAGLAADVTQLT